MDFAGLHADRNRILTKHYTAGRSGKSIQMVVVHYNMGDLSIDGCYDTWQTRAASAHYQVQSDGLIGQLVWDANTAWHAGNWDANCKSIGVEHANRGDSITDECLESGAHLVAALCLYYKLGRPKWGVNVFPHNHFSSTDCPGPLREGTSYHDRYMRRAGEWYDAMASGSEPAPSPAPSQPAGLDLGDKSWTGPKMIREWQGQLGTSVDGVISGQTEFCRSRLVRVERGCLVGTSGGSDLVAALQRKIGVDVDRYAGSGTISGLQRWLKDRGWYSDEVDGYYGANTSTGVGLALEAGAFRQ